MRRRSGDTRAIEMLLQRCHVLVEHTEAQVLELLLSRHLEYGPPAVRIAEGMQVDALAVAANVQSELGVEALRHIQVRHAEHKAIQ